MEEKIQADLKQAMLAKDEIKVSTLRLLIAELKNAKISKGQDLEDADVISVVQKELKKRKESVEAFQKAGREEAAGNEQAEIEVLEEYLPLQMSDEELTKIVESSISEACELTPVKEIGSKEGLQIGKIIGIVMSKVGNRADGSRVSSLVRQKLQS